METAFELLWRTSRSLAWWKWCSMLDRRGVLLSRHLVKYQKAIVNLISDASMPQLLKNLPPASCRNLLEVLPIFKYFLFRWTNDIVILGKFYFICILTGSGVCCCVRLLINHSRTIQGTASWYRTRVVCQTENEALVALGNYYGCENFLVSPFWSSEAFGRVIQYHFKRIPSQVLSEVLQLSCALSCHDRAWHIMHTLCLDSKSSFIFPRPSSKQDKLGSNTSKADPMTCYINDCKHYNEVSIWRLQPLYSQNCAL